MELLEGITFYACREVTITSGLLQLLLDKLILELMMKAHGAWSRLDFAVNWTAESPGPVLSKDQR